MAVLCRGKNSVVGKARGSCSKNPGICIPAEQQPGIINYRVRYPCASIGGFIAGRKPERQRPFKTTAYNIYFPEIPFPIWTLVISDMNDFLRGMTSVGQLFPAPTPYSSYPFQDSALRGVVNSFYQTRNNLRAAIKEFSERD
jgi:hypothetical protein